MRTKLKKQIRNFFIKGLNWKSLQRGQETKLRNKNNQDQNQKNKKKIKLKDEIKKNWKTIKWPRTRITNKKL